MKQIELKEKKKVKFLVSDTIRNCKKFCLCVNFVHVNGLFVDDCYVVYGNFLVGEPITFGLEYIISQFRHDTSLDDVATTRREHNVPLCSGGQTKLTQHVLQHEPSQHPDLLPTKQDTIKQCMQQCNANENMNCPQLRHQNNLHDFGHLGSSSDLIFMMHVNNKRRM